MLKATKYSECFFLLLAMAVAPLKLNASELTRLADAVDEQATLYRSIEVILHGAYELQDKRELSDRHSKTITTENHVVFQDSWLHWKSDALHLADSGKTSQERSRTVFDGESTKKLINRTANYANHKLDEPACDRFRPHNLLLIRNSVYFPISWLIRGGKAMQVYPANSYAEGKEIITEYLGIQITEGRQCEKIRIFQIDSNSKTRDQNGWTDIWFAKDLNLIPVRFECYHPRTGMSKPNQIGRVTAFTELGVGLYFPKSFSIDAYDIDPISNEVHPFTSARYSVKKVALDPNYPRSFFQQIELMPGKSIIYELDKDNKIAKQYEIDLSEPAVYSNYLWLIISCILVVLAALAMIVVKYRHRRNSA